MFSLGTVIVLAILALLVGAAAGAFAFRQFGGQGDMAKRLQEAEREFRDYQADVTEHFEETSRRVNELTRSYKDVHEYLASSAMKLTNPQMSRAISQSAHKNLPDRDGISAANSAANSAAKSTAESVSDEADAHAEKSQAVDADTAYEPEQTESQQQAKEKEPA